MLVLLLAASLYAADNAVRLPGSYVTVALPAGFRAATATPGMEDKARKILLTSQRLPKNAFGATLSLETLPQMMKSLGHKILTQETLTVDGKKARFLHGEQKEGQQMVLGLDGPSQLDLVVANFKDAKDKDRMRALMLTARVVASEPDIFDGLPVRLTIGAPLKVLGNGSGTSLQFTADGKVGALPMINVVVRTVPGKPKLDEANAAEAFDAFSGPQRQIKSTRQVKVNQWTAIEYTGTGKAGRTPTAFDSLLILKDNTFIFVDAQAVSMRAAEDMPKLRQMMFTLRPNTK